MQLLLNDTYKCIRIAIDLHKQEKLRSEYVIDFANSQCICYAIYLYNNNMRHIMIEYSHH